MNQRGKQGGKMKKKNVLIRPDATDILIFQKDK